MALSWGTAILAFKSKLSETTKDTEKDTQRVIDEVGRRMMKNAAAGTPVKSGRLRRGWRLKKQGRDDSRKNEVYNNVPYGPAVENGTSKTRPRHMLKKAKARAAADLRKLMKRSLKKNASKFNKG